MSEKKITIAIVEDEEKDMNLLLEYLDDFFRDKEQKAKILIYRDGLELLTAYQEGISLIFLDIQMNQVDGLTTAREIRKIDEDVLIVFTTNLYQLAVRGYEVDAFDFLVKPITKQAFQKRMVKAMSRLQRWKPALVKIPSGKNYRLVNTSRIRYVEVFGKTILFHMCDDKTEEAAMSLDAFAMLVKDRDFFQCHRSYLVNMNYVTNFTADTVILDADKIPMSKYRKREFMERLTKYING